jgi:preprotein translocase subunit SecG
MIFGFDVGSRFGNIMLLLTLLLVIVWLGVSIAYCVAKTSVEPRARAKPRKSRRQKFEEYWGDMDESARSTDAFNPLGRDEESGGGRYIR